MLIECGPTQVPAFRFHPGRDWKIAVDRNALRCVVVLRAHWSQYGARVALYCAREAARAYGFEVDVHGNVTNWYDVPHLWNLPNAGS